MVSLMFLLSVKVRANPFAGVPRARRQAWPAAAVFGPGRIHRAVVPRCVSCSVQVRITSAVRRRH
jgi:hypothetical protein